jgi:hypothetical protein
MTRLAVVASLLLVFAAPSFAQAPRDGRLLITVIDQSNAVLAGATVTITGLEPATRVTLAPVQTQANGVATIPGVPPGRYTIQAEFPGFDPGTLRDARVRAGDNRHIIVLPISKFEEKVAVAQDAQAGDAGADGRALR